MNARPGRADSAACSFANCSAVTRPLKTSNIRLAFELIGPDRTLVLARALICGSMASLMVSVEKRYSKSRIGAYVHVLSGNRTWQSSP